MEEEIIGNRKKNWGVWASPNNFIIIKTINFLVDHTLNSSKNQFIMVHSLAVIT